MWEVKLKGEDLHLSCAAENFASGWFYIRKEAAEYFLIAQSFSGIKDREDLQTTTEQILEYINTAIKIRANLISSVQTDGYYRVLDNGERQLDFFWVGNVEAPLTFIVYNAQAHVPSRWFDVWQSDPRVREAFTLFSNEHHDWFSLFKVYETIIYDDAMPKFGRVLIRDLMWASEDQEKLFFDTANWHRHARLGKHWGKPNSKPEIAMNLGQAMKFVRTIFEQWLNWKYEQMSSSTAVHL